MADITVRHESGQTYRVTVDDGRGSASYAVTAAANDVERLGEGASAETLIDASFRFLLDRESKESILPRFDLSVIGRYFPEYDERIGVYLP